MKRLLLDTHVLLWWMEDPALLSPGAIEAIRAPDAVRLFSVAAAWEMLIKSASGRLEVPGDLERVLAADFMLPLDITMRHAARAAALPPHHGDPFDRMMVAQAMEENLTLVTRDGRMTAYEVATLLA